MLNYNSGVVRAILFFGIYLPKPGFFPLNLSRQLIVLFCFI